MDTETTAATIKVVCPQCNATNKTAPERLTDAPRCGSCKAPLFDGHPVALAAAAFKQHVAHSDLPLVVDFWAPWCAPCRAMAPIFERAARELEPQARLAKVNTDEAQELAMQLGIRAIPTLAIFKGGKEVARTAGVLDDSRLAAWVRACL